MRALSILLFACAPLALGCSRAIPGGELDSATAGDSSTLRDLAPRDLATAGDSSTLRDLTARDLGACDPSRTRAQPGTGPIEVGTFCDVVELCVASQPAALAVVAAAPGFDCQISASGGGLAGCSPGEYLCEWRRDGNGGGGVDTVDADELAQLCAITVLAPPPDVIVCMVYL